MRAIFEFAARLAGMSRDKVSMVLNLDSRLENYPKLRSLLVDGEVSSNKLIRVVSLLDQESEDFWVDKVKGLSSRALEVLVRDYKVSIGGSLDSTFAGDLFGSEAEKMQSNSALFKIQKGFPEPQNSPKSLHVQRLGSKIDSSFHPSSLNLSDEVLGKLLKLQNKGVDINAMLLDMLNKRATEIEKEKEDLAQLEERKTIAGVKAYPCLRSVFHL